MNFVSIERKGSKLLERHLVIRRSCKRVYQAISVIMAKDKFKYRGNIRKLTPNDQYEYFYGYYDKSPWNRDETQIIALQVKKTYKDPAPKEKGNIVTIDLKTKQLTEIGKTSSWNVQQGCMAQWLGPDFNSRIIYNDFLDGKYCSVIYNINTHTKEKLLDMPIYDVSRDGMFALTLDFSRLHRMRPGYGYANIPDQTSKMYCPDLPCIWKINLKNGQTEPLLKYTDLFNFETRQDMIGAEHKVNHIMISPNGKRFMVLHRWIKAGHKYTRLVTANIDGSVLYNLSDEGYASHSCWKNDNEILSYLDKKERRGYCLMQDQTQNYAMLWDTLETDGHCSYSPDQKLIVTDTYPNRQRKATVFLCSENKVEKIIGEFFSPFRYDFECRCDLHPRWSRSGKLVCVDSVHEGKRGIYEIII